MRCCAILLLILLLPTVIHGQGNPYQRRALREQAVAWAGPQARAFVESGDDAALALLACSPSGAAKLVQFHDSGALGKMPRPPDLLRCIAMHGEDVLLFAIQHAKELEEPDAFSAFINTPLDYSLGLKQLEQGAAEIKAAKLSYYAASQNRQWNSKHLALFAGIAAIAGLVIWRRRRKPQGMGI